MSKEAFYIYFLMISSVSIIALFMIGILPFKNVEADNVPLELTPIKAENSVITTEQVIIPDIESGMVEYPEYPRELYIPQLERRIQISNPIESDLSVLEQELLTGAVRYPTSARVGEPGTVFIFGHSSSLPVVRNQNFKAFNGIQNLHTGDLVLLYSETAEYTYAVSSVREATVDGGTVPLISDGFYLVLSTCNNLKSKEDRFIVTAELVAVRQLP